MRNLGGKRLLICEEALTDFKGHFYSWIKAIRTINESAGVEVMVAGNHRIIREIKDEFKVIPVYTVNSWSGVYDYPQAWRRYAAVFLHNYRVWRQTRSLLKQVGPVDCVILTAVRIHQLLAWRQLCRESLGKDFKRVIIFILTSEAVYDDSFESYKFKGSSRLIQRVLKSFSADVAKGNVILAGDSHITCREYEALSGVPFKVFPSPAAGLQTIALPAPKIASADSAEDPCFVILGVSVIDKGIDVLQQAILKLLADDPDLKARFIIQWSTPTIDYNGNLVPIDARLRNARQVQLIETVLDQPGYDTILGSADFIVLPYRKKVYFNRISGVAVEAACAGIPMIVTENTWLSWAMDEFGAGVTVKENDPEDLAARIVDCIENRQSLKELASEKKQIAHLKNSAETYLSYVWD
jgi:glycosyltransferase involved in cell wall biosynthesis